MAKDIEQIKVILTEALEKESETERKAYLDEACRNDANLRAEVESLLRSHDKAGDFLEESPFGSDITLDKSPLVERPGTVIGRYKLLEQVGEGGFGVVYMAEQQQPIRRKVALKIIKLGMDTKSVIARFEAERQALAMMDHPNIAKVLDAGATETGRPYFVMELVTGVSITEYCDKNNLSTKERLALFIQVCNAVQHAHQKGIIHRDIKPTNVMVEHHDGKPVPKVIDFGIAKATNQRLTEKTLFTRYAHIIGTPAYMSPEQAELSALDVDTRSDIYSLGVLLYELLTGTTPFSEEELRNAGYIEMQRIIREHEPPKPSTKLSTLGQTLTDIAKYRGSTPELLTKAIRGDLDWIVMKSLEKDRFRRYETANGLAMDIQRHLEHEPVLARGSSTIYRYHKFLQRHRSQVIVALAIAFVFSGVTVILSMWNRDRFQLAEAEGMRHRNILSQAREYVAKANYTEALEIAKSILRSKHVGPEAQLLYAGILVEGRKPDEAVTMLEVLLNDRPEIAGAAHSLLARILWESDSPDNETLKKVNEYRQKAEELLPDTAKAYFLRAMTAITVKEQLTLLDRALQLDPAHYESRRLRAFIYNASRKYEKMKEDALVMAVLQPLDPLGYSLRAIALRELGKHTEAIAEYDRAIALTPKEDMKYIDLATQRCEVFLRMGDYERLISEAEACQKLSPDKPASVEGVPPSNRGQDARDTQDFSNLQYHIFSALTAMGNYDQATTLFQQIINPGHEARKRFMDWCAKYIFDTLEAGRSWHPVDREPAGAAFLPMVEAEEIYNQLSTKAKRMITDGFTARYSPDGKKIAFSTGFFGYSGLALYDVETSQTDLLIVPGKDPSWSPDGRYLAFVRDCPVLPMPEFASAERINRHRGYEEEEVWIMNADGTEPRRLATGGWPSWSSDAKHIYYQSSGDNKLYKMSVESGDSNPQALIPCSDRLLAISPNEKYVAYLEGQVLRIVELSSQKVVAEPNLPFRIQGKIWSLDSRELCFGSLKSTHSTNIRVGLWTYDLEQGQPKQVLEAPVHATSLASDGTRMLFNVQDPYFEIWEANFDPNVSFLQALGPGQTLDEHLREMVAFYTRRIKADPQDAYAYSGRADCYDCLHERKKVSADMRRWSAILSGVSSLASQVAEIRKIRRIISVPLDYQIVFSAERPVNEISLLNVAFGQKGRCNMKTFQIPILSTRNLAMSLLGLCLLSGLDAPYAQASFTFGVPENLESVIPVIDPAHELIGCLSYDELEIYITSNRPGGSGNYDLWVLRRASTDDNWDSPENLGPAINSPKSDQPSSISSDGLTLYFFSSRGGGYGSVDMYVTTRSNRNEQWGLVENLGPTINSYRGDGVPYISSNDLELYFNSWRDGGYGGGDLYVSKRATANDPWGEPENLGPLVNSEYHDVNPCISSDGCILFFSGSQSGDTHRPGGYGGADIWMTRRASHSAPWEAAVNLGPPVNGPAHEIAPRISPDGSKVYFTTLSAGAWENWQVQIIPICDFNGNGQVNGKDVLCMASCWSTDDPLCDIGPFAWGDGTVDLQDLIVLSEYLGKEFIDPTLIAHWALDEAEGDAANDSVSGEDSFVLGEPVWQPDGGMVGGALELDGIDDCIITSTGPNPVEGSFSIVAWIKCSTRSQVIVSQPNGSDWLAVDVEGKLMTELNVTSGQSAAPLLSQALITDDQWHHIGLVWDGSRRMLGIDSVIVAEDTQDGEGVYSSGLYIGVGKDYAADTYFSGLIDDVRIYNRVVSP